MKMERIKSWKKKNCVQLSNRVNTAFNMNFINSSIAKAQSGLWCIGPTNENKPKIVISNIDFFSCSKMKMKKKLNIIQFYHENRLIFIIIHKMPISFGNREHGEEKTNAHKKSMPNSRLTRAWKHWNNRILNTGVNFYVCLWFFFSFFSSICQLHFR